MSKFKIGCMIVLGIFSFSGNPNYTISRSTSEMMNPIDIVICDDDGFVEVDILSVQNEVLQGFGGGAIEEAIVISTSTGYIIQINDLLGAQTTQVICDLSVPLSDVAVDENEVIYATNFTNIFSLDNTTCVTNGLPNVGITPGTNSLSFDTQGNLYYGGENSSSVYRYDSDEMSPPYIWHNFGSGSPSGDFVILGDKMYISWSISGGVRLYEVTIDAAFNYISHIDLGPILGATFGLASELGQLYGVTTSELYRIDLDSFTLTTIATNDFTYGSWFGAAGLHEAFNFEATTHVSLSDANNNVNPLPDTWTNTQQGMQTVYVRVINTVTGVFEVVEVNITITDTVPNLTTSSGIAFCDDGSSTFMFDLTDVEATLLQNVTNPVTVSYYNSEADVIADTNAINSNYTTTQNLETIYVRVQNINDDCFATSQFPIMVNAAPIIVTPDDVIECGVQNNGIVDLTQVETELLQNNTITVSTTYHLTAGNAATGTNAISSDFQATLGQQIIYVRVASTASPECFETTQFTVTLSENPQITIPSDINQCEDENNGFFDLTQVEAELLQNNTLPVTISYYASLADASIAVNPISTNYQIAVGQVPIFVRVQSTINTECFEIASFQIIRNGNLQLTMPNNLIQCDNENNGVFDLTEVENQLLQNVTDAVTVTYHTSQANASAGIDAIPTNYQIPLGQETIYVRVENTTNTNCFVTSQFDIIQSEIPQVTTPSDLIQCPNENNGLFDLTQVESEVLQNVTATVNVSYHATEADADTNTNAINTNYDAQSNQDVIYLRVENTISICFAIIQFQVITPEHLGITMPSNLTRCENENSLVFNLTEVEAELLQGVTQNVEVSYHASANDANTNTDALATDYILTSQQATIHVRVEDVVTNCFETTQFTIEILTSPTTEPIVNSPGARLLTDCYIDANNDGFFNLNDGYPLIVTTGNTNYTTEFFLSEADAQQGINTIDPIFYAINDIQEVFVAVTNENGCTSTSNFFIDPGCYDTVVDITNISFPAFFTPNGDAANDTWNVRGISTIVQQTSTMYIFDRYGKLLYYFRPGQIPGWDGTYRGRLMPSSDYWYKFETAEGQSYTGSFSLIL